MILEPGHYKQTRMVDLSRREQTCKVSTSWKGICYSNKQMNKNAEKRNTRNHKGNVYVR